MSQKKSDSVICSKPQSLIQNLHNSVNPCVTTALPHSTLRMMGQEKLKRNSPRLSTVGIVVSDWTYYKRVKESQTSLKSITFMTWDFGGQVGPHIV